MLKKFNELNSTTYLSAADKATHLNQKNRANRLSNFVFHDFVGKDINGNKIKFIKYSGTKKALVIGLENYGIITYFIKEDKVELTEISLDRKSAVILSKIIQKANPNTKYKSVNNFTIKGY